VSRPQIGESVQIKTPRITDVYADVARHPPRRQRWGKRKANNEQAVKAASMPGQNRVCATLVVVMKPGVGGWEWGIHT